MMQEQNLYTLLRKSLHQIRYLKQTLKTKTLQEPIAVISMACRFPGGSDTPEAFWELLKAGREGLCDIPKGRWDHRKYYDQEAGKASKMYIQQANFLAEDVALFDPKLFNISPREAEDIDPQHRLLLELTWEVIERSHQSPVELRGESVGTFIGVITSEYGSLPRDPQEIGPYSMTGVTNHMASGRIAHVFGFHGPALSFDTACSSSLVAVHQACQSLYNDECQLAIAGGVGCMLSPATFVSLCQVQALSRDGRCKPFAQGGDGYGRGEGAGLILLKRLSHAQRDQDPILAIILGSSLNHDGPSSGLTVPNGKAQKALLENAIQKAGIQPNEMGYVEAHGTGTALGDPIEFQSLKEVFGQNRGKDNRLVIGTCKANIGHLEAAAGVAGVIKTILCLQNKAIPPHINCDELNPRIHLDSIPAVLPSSLQPWNIDNGSSRIAGVSSFGFSGTNGHIILKEPPEDHSQSSPQKQKADRPVHALTISAQTPLALDQLIARYVTLLSTPATTDVVSLAYTANVGRAHFTQRIACVWSNKEDLLSSLTTFQKVKRSDKAVYYSGQNPDNSGKVTVLFPEFVIDSPGTLLGLLEFLPYFQKMWKLCEDAFRPHINQPLTDALSKVQSPTIENSLIHSAITFSLSYSVFRLLEYWGIQIHTVYAEKEGLYAMAASTNMLSLDEAANSLARRHVTEPSEVSPRIRFNMPRVRVLLPGKTEPLKRSDLADSNLLENVYNKTLQLPKTETLFHTENVMLCELNSTPHLSQQIYGEHLRTIPYTVLFQSDSVWEGLIHTAAACYSLGHQINWKRFDAGFSRRKVHCPTYPFQRRRYWIKEIQHTPALYGELTGNPLTGTLQKSLSTSKQVLFKFSLATLPDLQDTHGLVHIGYFLELLQSGAKESGYQEIEIQQMAFEVALLIPSHEEVEILLIMDEGEKKIDFSFHSFNKSSNQWEKHVYGMVSSRVKSFPRRSQKPTLESLQKKLINEQSGLIFYQEMQERGVSLGPSVQWIEHVWRQNEKALARFRIVKEKERLVPYRLGFHPGIWDACAQLFHATLDRSVASDSSFMVTQMGKIRFGQYKQSPNDTLWCYVESTGKANKKGYLEGKWTLYTDAGEMIATGQDYQMKELTAAHKKAFSETGEPSLKLGKRNEVLLASIQKAPSEKEQTGKIQEYLQLTLAKRLKLPQSEISVAESLLQMGMDSLVGLEFKTTIHQELGLDLPISTLIRGPTITELSQDIRQQLDLLSPQKERATFSLEDYSLDKKNWVRGERKKRIRIRLYCFPYAYHSAFVFRNWIKKFPEQIEIRPIELPGRGDRLNERPIESTDEIAERLTQILGKDLDQPYALFGHSAGALLAYAWNLYLQQTNRSMPRHLIVSAFTCPLISNPVLKMVREFYQRYGIDDIPTLEDILNPLNAEMVQKIVDAQLKLLTETEFRRLNVSLTREFINANLPAMVASLRMVSTFDPNLVKPVPVPITALHGKDDQQVDYEEMQAWQKLTTKSFSIQTFSGDHLFIDPDQSEESVIAYVNKILLT